MYYIVDYWYSYFGTIHSGMLSFDNKHDALICACNLIITKNNLNYNDYQNCTCDKFNHERYLFNLIAANKLEEAVQNCQLSSFKILIYENKLIKWNKKLKCFFETENKKEIFK